MGEEDPAEDMGEKEELEAEGQQEAVREGEREREEETGDETEPHSETRGKDCAVLDGEEEKHGGDGEGGKEKGDQDQVRGVGNAVGQRATTNNRLGIWRSWETRDTNGEDEESRTNSDEGETTARDEDGGAEERKKRAIEGDEGMDNSPLEERLRKRSKSERGENEDDTAMEDSFGRGLKTPPRSGTASPMPSPGSTTKIVRQTSVVPGLEDTESAVWDAARRDAVSTSLRLQISISMRYTTYTAAWMLRVVHRQCFKHSGVTCLLGVRARFPSPVYEYGDVLMHSRICETNKIVVETMVQHDTLS